jgi:hypothetical protein
MKPCLVDLRATPEALRQVGEAAGARGDASFQRDCFTLAVALHERRLAEPEASLAEIAAAAMDLRATVAQMGVVS